MGHSPQHVVGGVQQHRRVERSPSSGATVTWSLWPCVQTTATTLRPPTASTIGCAVWAASKTTTSLSSPTIQMLLSTSQLPPSSSNVPCVTTRSMRVRAHSTTTERSTSPACILWNASSTCVEPDALGDELLQRQPALQVEADQRREVALGQAVAVPRRLQRAAAGEEVDQRHLQRHVRRRNTDQHDGAGEVAGVERLLPGFRTADRVDHHVGAEAVGEVLDRLDRVDLARR